MKNHAEVAASRSRAADLASLRQVSHFTHKTMLSPRTLSLFYIENTSVHRKGV